MPISLVAVNTNEIYYLNKQPALLIKEGKEYYVTESGSMFPASEFTYTFTLEDNKFHLNRFDSVNVFDKDAGYVRG